MNDETHPDQPFPLISMKIQSPRAGSNFGRHAKIWLHPDGSVTWEPYDMEPKPRRPWWRIR